MPFTFVFPLVFDTTLAAAVPTFSVLAAWSGQLTGILTVGRSTVGGTDVVGGAFGGNVYDDITAEVKHMRLVPSGRRSIFEQASSGSATITVADASGKYNARNISSVLYGQLEPMRPIRVEADSTPLWRGYVKRIRYRMKPKEAIFECVDLFEWLDLAKPVIATVTNYRVDQIIGLILDAAQYTDPALRSLETGGDVIASWSADGSTSATDLIKNLLATDMGLFTVGPDGVATYLTRGSQFAPGTPVGTLSGAIVGSLEITLDAAAVINGQTCTRTGSTAQYEYDPTSQRQYGQRDGEVIDSANFGTDTEAGGLARWIVMQRGNPRVEAFQIKLINRNADTLTQQLNRRINDLVIINTDEQTAFYARIQASEHEVSESQQVIETLYTVEEQLSISYLVVGTSTVGGADLVAAAA